MKQHCNKLISNGAIIALIGFITSGPLGLILVKLIKPQPAWISAAVFAANYHFVQDIPYYFGFLLIAGMLMIAAGHYLHYTGVNRPVKFQLLLALLLTTAFASLIFFNYICQTTFIRHLAIHYTAQNDSIIATFTMANPMSLSWAVEMWGYGILSIATIVFSILDMNWVLTTIGLIAYMVWNILMIGMMMMIYRNSRPGKIDT
ncbi:hypothetical protein [Flavihumibacter fluvii]|uniref:hypothetical protein n=1 Tax=Flavihumibacter fluvii TaxID=2838157 RepID=UPI001BDE2CF7|nr:hypothetical protein [Flavihumibacter fluvii]ULQ51772.1 hypothetical protein KJS93_16920 [Flavihumibacter fluvii]